MGFVRIDPDNKVDRVAIFIVNYNMIERANKLVENIKETVKHPVDIILVDNGSDLVGQSDYTAIRLERNVQTTNGWLTGVAYSDAIANYEGFKYFAYCFIITSTEPIEKEKDIIAIMVEKMKADDDIVGIHPSLTRDSTTAWGYMKHVDSSKDDKPRPVKMIDNICSLYRADWFNKIGRFNPELTYAWGIDIETGYLARKGGKKVCIDDSIQVKKVTNIGYTMKRMNMSANDRSRNAYTQMTKYFMKKYGPNFNRILN